MNRENEMREKSKHSDLVGSKNKINFTEHKGVIFQFKKRKKKPTLDSCKQNEGYGGK